MKTINKILALIMFASIMLICSTVKAQLYPNPVGSPYTSPVTHDELQSQTGVIAILGGNGSGQASCCGSGLIGIGINNNQPAYMLDLLCDPTTTPASNMDVNIGCPNCTPTDAVGYRIGGLMFAWHGGDITSGYFGVGAGFTNTSPLPSSRYHNTFVGYLAGESTSGAGGGSNTFIGSESGTLNTSGLNNVYVGSITGYYNVSGSYNTFEGCEAGEHNTADNNTYLGFQSGNASSSGTDNTFWGFQSGYTNTTGSYNTFGGYWAAFDNTVGAYNTIVGYQCGEHNVVGTGNSFYGKDCAVWNTSGDKNAAFGAHASNYNSEGNYNVVAGFAAEYTNPGSYNDVIIGYNADYNGGTASVPSNYNVLIGDECAPSHQTGNYNILLGATSDISDGVGNSGVIGANATVSGNNSIILGNNTQWTGIGLSNSAPYAGSGYPSNSLEICARDQSTGALISNWSGLRFTNLTSSSPLGSPQPGVLSLDASGDVIYVSGSTGTGIGLCSSPTTFPSGSDPAIDLGTNTHNFWFLGSGVSSLYTNVLIGYSCGSTIPAKLSVNQNSGGSNTNTVAGYFENDDAPATYSGSTALIGVEGYIPDNVIQCYPLEAYTVGGWFEADGLTSCASYPTYGTAENYAIFVPNGTTTVYGGGGEAIGYAWASQPFVGTGCLLNVNSGIQALTNYYPSDSTIKKNVTSFKYGLKAIRNLNPVSYKYNGIGGFDSAHTYIGLIAQNLARNVPSGVGRFPIIKDTISRDTATILSINEQAVMYTAINAIKQLDSTVTSNKQIQQQTIDSLRTIIISQQNCINELCGDGHSSIHHSDGNLDDNGTGSFSNVQDVTLSATNEPLLYQNTPNPFSSGTKINYYLPEGTQGATMLFYDSYGSQLKIVTLSETGNGTLNVTSDNLSAGIYSYSLVVNGKVIDTKRMILQK